MAADGGQYSTPFTVTTSAGLAVSYGFRAHCIQIVADTSNTTVGFFDFTGGTSVIATTSISFPVRAGEKHGPFIMGRDAGFWTGFSAIGNSSGSVPAFTGRVIAL